MSPSNFREHVSQLTAELVGRPLDAQRDVWLNKAHGVGSSAYEQLRLDGQTGVAEGWLCDREGGGIRYGRIFEPAGDLHDFSVDVGDMNEMAGQHHAHPDGEIDLIMPLDEGALFARTRWRQPRSNSPTATAASTWSCPMSRRSTPDTAT
ncbi:hypothetical protein BH11PSE8_BH11PSE8_22150 [soil metagenome]